jgi:hypothetical protein
MALISIKRRGELAEVLALAPERYDPRRELRPQAKRATLLRHVANVLRRTVQPSDKLGKCLVLDTSDAREGILAFRKQLVDGADIGSAKKVIEPGQVIISRLRPYLRQVALVDPWMQVPGGTLLICSTEFFVLSGVDGRSIAFLVPFLLTDPVQAVLAASQEGGHHPRFDGSALLSLPVPEAVLRRRDEDSAGVEECVRLFRQSEARMAQMVQADAEALDSSGG